MSRTIWRHSLVILLLLFACSPTVIKKTETKTEVKIQTVTSDTGQGAAVRDTIKANVWVTDPGEVASILGVEFETPQQKTRPQRRTVRRQISVTPDVKADIKVVTDIDSAGNIITEVTIPKITYPETTKTVHETEDRTETYAKYFIWFAILAVGAMVIFAIKGIF